MKILPTYLRKTALSQGKDVYCIGLDWSDFRLWSLAHVFVFHLYKQSSSDSRVAIEMEHAVTFSSSLLNGRKCAHLHLGSTVVAAITIARAP